MRTDRPQPEDSPDGERQQPPDGIMPRPAEEGRGAREQHPSGNRQPVPPDVGGRRAPDDSREEPPDGGREQPPDGEREQPRVVAAPASRAERLAAHESYRETVAATERAASDRDGDRAAWSRALPELRAAWAEHKERYPEHARAVPRTEVDGSWSSGDHRRLDPEQNTEADKAHADLADEASRHILPALRRIEAADPERKLAGLEHMIKGEDRLKEKLADAWHGRPGLSAGQALSLIPDAVRSTLTYSSERYAEGVLADIDRFKAEGFELIKLKNLWHAEQYKGINSQWFRSESGTRFEMQFHTPESLEAKELTHEAYERIRSNAALPVEQQDPAEEEDLDNFQRRANALVSVPPGTDRIKDFPEKSDA
jgi:hypothetical protein